MSHAELTNSNHRLLKTLVNQYQRTEAPVKSDDLAETVDRTPGSVRNQMQTLRSLGLVEGVPGPTGGYEPTERAFDVIDREHLDDAETLTLSRDHERVEITVDEIDFTNVHHPEECTAHVAFQQAAEGVDVDDHIAIGPTPIHGLAVFGTVRATSDTADEVVLDVGYVEAPVEE